MTYTEPMSRTARIVFRVQPDVRAAVFAEAKERGQSITEFAERALKESLSSTATGRKLAATLSEANGRGINEQSGSAPVPSTPHGTSAESDRDGVKPAAPSQDLARLARQDDADAEFAEVCKTGPHRESRRANIGPKPLSATKPRPKAVTRKAKP